MLTIEREEPIKVIAKKHNGDWSPRRQNTFLNREKSPKKVTIEKKKGRKVHQLRQRDPIFETPSRISWGGRGSGSRLSLNSSAGFNS